MKKIILNNEDEFFLENFIFENTQPDVEPLTNEEIKSLNTLRVGDYIYINTTKVERIR